jgi:hypothetical protein
MNPKSIIQIILLILLFPAILLAQDSAAIAPDSTLKEMGPGKLVLLFFDAKTGNPLCDGTITIGNSPAYRSDLLGRVIFDRLPDGIHTLHFYKDGYVSADYEIKIKKGVLYFNRFSVSPLTENGTIRIVLEWDKAPADLDLHFVRENYYHVSYLITKVGDGSAQLDRDDKNAYGPETVTISKIDKKAIYSCYVVDFTNQASNNSRVFMNSKAQIRIYSNNKLTHTIPICKNIKNNKWVAFQIINGEITFKKCRSKPEWLEDLYVSTQMRVSSKQVDK